MNLMRFSAIGYAFLALVTLPVTIEARQNGVVSFRERFSLSDTTFVLNCAGVLRYMSLIRVYAAALYLGEGISPENVLEDVPKRLEIEYFRKFAAEDFAQATQKHIVSNCDAPMVAQLQNKIDRLNRLYEDVPPGDRYALT